MLDWGVYMGIKLYCGGQFNFDYLNSDYYEKAKDDYRSILLGKANKLLQKRRTIKLTDNVSYIGPFYFESDGMMDKDIVKAETSMINKCTNAVFLLDNGCCPGTIAELILAASLKKDITIFYIRRSDNEETESTLHTPCWFPIIMSKLITKNVKLFSCNSYSEATSKIKEYVNDF